MLNRRDAMIRLGQLGLGGLTLPNCSPPAKRARRSRRTSRRPTACIFVFLWGGPPQQDMWDMKPDAPAGIRVAVRADRHHRARHPRLRPDAAVRPARRTRRASSARCRTGSNNHEPSRLPHADRAARTRRSSCRGTSGTRRDFPIFGSVVSHFTPPGAMPATVTIPRPIGHDGVTYSGTYAGFLGPRHDPFEQRPGQLLDAAGRAPDDPAAGPGRDADSSGPARPAQDHRGAGPPRSRAAGSARPGRGPRAGDADGDVRRPCGGRSTSTASRPAFATATAATSTARASCWPAGWSRRASRW